MTKITPAAADRCAKKSLQEQLEDCRRQMQRDSGAGDMAEVTQHLNHDNWQTRVSLVTMPCDGCD